MPAEPPRLDPADIEIWKVAFVLSYPKSSADVNFPERRADEVIAALKRELAKRT